MPAWFHRADYASVVVWYVISYNELTAARMHVQWWTIFTTFTILKYNFLLYFMEFFYDLILLPLYTC